MSSANVHGKVDEELGDQVAEAVWNWGKCSRGLGWSIGRATLGRLTLSAPALRARLGPVILLGRPNTPAQLRPGAVCPGACREPGVRRPYNTLRVWWGLFTTPTTPQAQLTQGNVCIRLSL